jgi:hypothetical protein
MQQARQDHISATTIDPTDIPEEVSTTTIADRQIQEDEEEGSGSADIVILQLKVTTHCCSLLVGVPLITYTLAMCYALF